MPYVIGNRAVQLEDEPQSLDGPVYVPLKEVATALGANVAWDTASETATVSYNGRSARVFPSSTTVGVDGQSKTMSVPSYMTDGKTWVPVEFFEVAFGVIAIADASTTPITVRVQV